MREEKNEQTAAEARAKEPREAVASRPAAQKSSETEIDLVALLLVYAKKWLLLCVISGVVALAVFLVITLAVNRGAKQYSAVFSFDFPEKETGLYPDGTTFTYMDFLSEENISETLKANDSKFGKFTSSGVAKNMTIRQEYEETDKKEKIYTGRWILTAKASYFGSQDDFVAFVTALLNQEATKIRTVAEGIYYDSYLDAFDDATTFQSKLSYLSRQKNYIIDIYDGWIEVYGRQFTVDYPIIRYRNDVDTAFSAEHYNRLKNELSRRQYTFDSALETAENLKISIELLMDESEDNAKKIQNLSAALETLRATESAADITSKSNETLFYETIATLTQRQVDIEREVENINIQIANISLKAETAAYLEKLQNVRSILAEETRTLSRVSKLVYEEKTEFSIDNSTLKTTGTQNAILYAALAFVVVYLIVGFFLYIIRANEKTARKRHRE
ncbi:MAG: hypothetical protein ILO68_06615 [Clostridia bacterium]|nr:hypothetical protein [Clostridia bacterium]